MALKGMLGRKLGMTTVFGAAGAAIPVTVLEVGPCTVVQVKTPDRDGYEAAQIAFDPLPPQTRKGGTVPRGQAGHRGRGEVNRPLAGHYQKAGASPHRHLAEFSLAGSDDMEVGARVTVDGVFSVGQSVNVYGTSRGRGFQGVMRRWNFAGQGDSHGQKIHRKPASQGATDPARVFKGSKRPGRMGNCTAAVRNLTVVQLIPERNLLLVKGAVPGHRGSLLRVEAN